MGRTITITTVGMIAIWMFLALMFLLDRKLFDQHRKFHYLLVSIFLFWCLFALVFGGFVPRMYAAISIIGMAAVQVLIRQRRRNLT